MLDKPGYDITSVQPAGRDKLLVTGVSYDLAVIQAHVDAHDISSSALRYTERHVLDLSKLH